MQLNKQAIERVQSAKFNGETTADLLKLIATHTDVAGAASGAITLDYQRPGDTIERGDLIPVLTFSVRPATYPEGMVDDTPAEVPS